MDRKQALELVNQMIEEQKGKGLRDTIGEAIKEIRVRHVDSLRKSIDEVKSDLAKVAAPSMPSPHAKQSTISTKIAKVDPTTKLPGTLLDKSGLDTGNGGNNMGTSNMSVTNSDMIKVAPNDAAPMAASEKAKSSVAQKMAKCMSSKMAKGSTAVLSMNQSLNKDMTPVSRPDKGFGAIIAKDELMVKDDKPHPPGSPEDQAHDIVESGGSMKNAVQSLSNNPEKVQKMLAHLRNRKKEGMSWERSPENRAAGMEKAEDAKIEDISKDAEKAIVASADKPMKIAENRPGQANEPKADKKI